MKIINSIRDSIYNATFYKQLQMEPFGDSFSYFLKLLLIFSIFLTAIWSSTLVPTLSKILKPESIASLVNRFPEDLKITIKKGEASSNAKEPYVIKVPSNLKSSGVENDISQYENLLVLDTKATTLDLQKFEKYDAKAMLTKNFLVVRDSQKQKIEIQKLESFPDTAIDRVSINRFIEKLQPYFKFAIPLMLIGLFLVLFITFLILDGLIILAGAIGIFIIAKIKRLEIDYVGAYQIGLHSITVAVLLDILLTIFGYHLPYLFYLVITLVMAWLNLKPTQTT